MLSHEFAAARIRMPLLLSALLLITLTPLSARSAPVPGFREDFPDTSVSGWGGQVILSNPGTNGVFGPGDGYLVVTRATKGHLGTQSFGLVYTGDWIAAGITQVQIWLNDVNGANALEMHFSIGNFGNFWQYNPGFVPPLHAWAPFTVDLTSSADFTQTIGVGTFAQALQAVDRIHIRHDFAPYIQLPDSITGDVGIDHLLFTDGIVGVDRSPAPRPRALQLAPPHPNPSSGSVGLVMESFVSGPVRIQIVDIMGRVVREALLPDAGPGERLWVWDGRDAFGRPTAAGVYKARATGPSGGMTRTLVRVR